MPTSLLQEGGEEEESDKYNDRPCQEWRLAAMEEEGAGSSPYSRPVCEMPNTAYSR